MPVAVLPSSGWLPYNHAVLSRLLASLRAELKANLQGGPPAQTAGGLRPHKVAARPPAAVFDWDNTCILGDIGDATFVRQLELGAFALSAEEAAERLRRWPQVPAADIADIEAAWRVCTVRAGPGGPHAAWQHEAPLALAELQARLGWAVQQVLAGAGERTGEAFLWQAGWLDGLSEGALAAVVAGAWRAGLARPIEEVFFQTPSTHGGGGGHRRCGWRLGLRRCPQMESLLSVLAAAGVDCWVVTASHQEVVRALLRAEPSLGGNALSPERVVGMQPLAGDAPITWRAGKVEAIVRQVGAAPRLVAGDAETDLEMLTAFTPPCLSLLIHRALPAPMSSLYAQAAAAAAEAGDATPPEARTAGCLLQGRDEATGELVPSHWRRGA